VRRLAVAFGVDLESPLLPKDAKSITILNVIHLIGLIVELIGMVNILRVDLVPG